MRTFSIMVHPGGGYFGPYIYAIDKAAIYAGPGSITVPLFQADFNATCLTSATPETRTGVRFHDGSGRHRGQHD